VYFFFLPNFTLSCWQGTKSWFCINIKRLSTAVGTLLEEFKATDSLNMAGHIQPMAEMVS